MIQQTQLCFIQRPIPWLLSQAHHGRLSCRIDDIIAQADALVEYRTINDKRRDAILQANETARNIKYRGPGSGGKGALM